MAATPRPVFAAAKGKTPASFGSGLLVGAIATIAGCLVGMAALLYFVFLALIGPAHGRNFMAVPIFLVPTVTFLAIGTAIRAMTAAVSRDYLRGALLASAGTFVVMLFLLT